METFLSLQISYANRILTTGLGPLLENVPFRSAMLLLQVHESAFGVRREKAALSSGCKPHPAIAPAGSNRSSHGGNEVAEAFG